MQSEQPLIDETTVGDCGQPGADVVSRDSLLMLRAIEHTRDAVFISRQSDERGSQIAYSNPAFTQLTGYAANEVLGLSPDILNGPETCAESLKIVRDGIASGCSFAVQLTQYKKSGATVHVQCKADPVFEADGHPSHWIHFLTKGRDRRQQENENARQREQLYDAMRRNVVGEIAAGTIHESLQPLYAIGNLAAACRNKLTAGGDVDHKRILHWLETIVNTVSDAKSLLQQLRGFADDTVPNRRQLSMSEVVMPIVQMLAADFRYSDIEFESSFDCNCLVEVDASQIRQVVAELVFNARNCFDRNDKGKKRIELNTWYENDSCHVLVKDNGPGVPQEELGNIFKPFCSRDTRRLGLGLNFCKSAVSAHGGTLFAKLNDTGGFSVHFTIPGTGKPPNVKW